MKSSRLKKLVIRGYLPRLGIAILLLAITIIVIVKSPINKRFHTKTLSDIEEIDKSYNDNRYINLETGTLYYSGMDYCINNKTKARIYYREYNDVCYFFILSDKNLPSDYSIIDSRKINAVLTKDSDMFKSIIDNISKKYNFSPKYMEDLSNSILINEYSYNNGSNRAIKIGIYIIIVILALHIIWELLVFLFPYMSYMFFPLHKYGSRRKLYYQASREMAGRVQNFSKNMYLTDNFVISYAKQQVDIIPIENIVWIYSFKEIKHKKGKAKIFNPMCIVTDSKKIYKVPHISDVDYKILSETLQTKCPSIMLGYDKIEK